MEPVLHIYVIDDNSIDRLIIETLLKHNLGAVKVSLFSSAEIALKDLADRVISNHDGFPHVILLDLDMPVKDGWAFLEAFERIAVNIDTEKPLIYLLTASIHPKDAVAADKHALVDGLYIKPFTQAAIKAIQEKYIDLQYQL